MALPQVRIFVTLSDSGHVHLSSLLPKIRGDGATYNGVQEDAIEEGDDDHDDAVVDDGGSGED